MKSLCKVLAIVAGVLIAGYLVAEDSPKKEARVTRIIRDVKVLPSGSPARPAALDEMVRENTGVRTGDESRSELTFADLTITRLGANTVFNFNRAGRSAELGNGSMLLRIPKESGGATIRSSSRHLVANAFHRFREQIAPQGVLPVRSCRLVDKNIRHRSRTSSIEHPIRRCPERRRT